MALGAALGWVPALGSGEASCGCRICLFHWEPPGCRTEKYSGAQPPFRAGLSRQEGALAGPTGYLGLAGLCWCSWSSALEPGMFAHRETPAGSGVGAPAVSGGALGMGSGSAHCHQSLLKAGGTLALPVAVHGALSCSHLGKVSLCCGTPGEGGTPQISVLFPLSPSQWAGSESTRKRRAARECWQWGRAGSLLGGHTNPPTAAPTLCSPQADQQ